MAKIGRDDELEKLADEFLKKHDTDKKKKYKSERQMKRKSIKEMPISNLNAKQSAEMENMYYGIVTYDD